MTTKEGRKKTTPWVQRLSAEQLGIFRNFSRFRAQLECPGCLDIGTIGPSSAGSKNTCCFKCSCGTGGAKKRESCKMPNGCFKSINFSSMEFMLQKFADPDSVDSDDSVVGVEDDDIPALEMLNEKLDDVATEEVTEEQLSAAILSSLSPRRGEKRKDAMTPERGRRVHPRPSSPTPCSPSFGRGSANEVADLVFEDNSNSITIDSLSSQIVSLAATVKSIQASLEELTLKNVALEKENLMLKSGRQTPLQPPPSAILFPPTETSTDPPDPLPLVSSVGHRSWADIVKEQADQVRNSDKEAVLEAMKMLRAPPIKRRGPPTNKSTGEDTEARDELEKKHKVRKVYFKNINRQSFSDFKSRLRTLRFHTSRIKNISFVGTYSVEFILDPSYVVKFTRDFTRLCGAVEIKDYNPLAPAGDDSPSDDIINQMKANLLRRIGRELATTNNSQVKSFYEDWDHVLSPPNEEEEMDWFNS